MSNGALPPGKPEVLWTRDDICQLTKLNRSTLNHRIWFEGIAPDQLVQGETSMENAYKWSTVVKILNLFKPE